MPLFFIDKALLFFAGNICSIVPNSFCHVYKILYVIRHWELVIDLNRVKILVQLLTHIIKFRKLKKDGLGHFALR